MEDVRRVRPEVRPEERRPRAQLLDELDELGLRVLPGEVRVRLREAGLREQRHHRRARERLGEEDGLRDGACAPRRSATPRTGRASCAGCRRGTPSRRRRTSGARRRGSPSRAPSGRPSPSRGCGCPGSAWAGSRRTSATRRGGAGTTPGARRATGGRATSAARGRARAPCPCSRSAATSAGEVGLVAEARVDRVVAALRGADRPRAPDVAGLGALGVVRAPCGSSGRSGGSAGGRRRRTRARRAPGRPVSTPASPPQERGNSSYQAPARARSPLDVDLEGGARAPPRARSRRRARAAAARHSSTRSRARTAPPPRRARPLRSAWPAATLRSCSSSQPACRSTQASISNRQRPTRVDLEASPRSGRCRAPRAAPRASVPSGGGSGRRPRSVSCPSRTIVAATSTRSPTHAFAGQRPQSTCGVTSEMMMRSAAHPRHTVNSPACGWNGHSGVQLHPTSLPGGRLGPEAYAFVDWLAAAGARWWQVLPLNPPDEFGSPYASASAFASWGGLARRPGRARSTPSDGRTLPERETELDRATGRRSPGDGAVEEQVRFDREWGALRALRGRARRADHRGRPHLRRGRRLRPR